MLSLRHARPSDVSLLKILIHEFAAFERLSVIVTEADLARDGFGERPKFRALIAEWNAQPAGYALFFDYYSTFHGRPGIFVEDVYVRAQFRGNGIGKAFFARLAEIALHEDCFGLRWQVLDWNTSAIEFYRKLGATFLDEWRTLNLEGESLQRLASGEPIRLTG
jgi:GNAT superfamily N-acetyltransferase